MKRVSIFWGLVILMLSLSACGCEHEFGAWTTKVEATCASEGIQERVCDKCDATEERAIMMNAHAYGEWTVEKESTCSVAGVTSRVCKSCGNKEEQAAELKEHSYDGGKITKEATCVESGLQLTVCVSCGDTEETVVPVTDHTFGKWTTTKQATCTSSGMKSGACSVCGKVQDAEIAATGHNWASATCVTPKTCKTCGEISGSVGGHSWKPATCSSAKTCSRCGLTEGSALGHSYGASGACNNCGKKMVSISLKIPSVGTENAYASLVVTNYTDSTISFPKMLSINGKTCNGDSAYQVGAGKSATLSYYRAVVPSQRYDKKYCDMYLDNNSIGYCVIRWNGTQYYAEYGVNGLTTFYRGNVNGPA